MLIFHMSAKIKFDRPISKQNGTFISPGGYEFETNGKTINFDFTEYQGSINELDNTVLETYQRDPDVDSFKDLETLTIDDLKNISKINDFYVDTGEDEDALKPVEIQSVEFEVYEDGSLDYTLVEIPKDILDEYNKTIK